MGAIVEAMAGFGTVSDKKKVLAELQGHAASSREAWLTYAQQKIDVFGVASIERIAPADALKSLGIALCVESPDVDRLLSYIEGPDSGFRDPAEGNELDPRMLAAVRKGFVEARQYGFSAMNQAPLFGKVDTEDMDTWEYETYQNRVSDYSNHITYHLPVPRLYTKGKGFGKCNVRSPSLYEALFDHEICQTGVQLREIAQNKDYDALEKLAGFTDTPEQIRSVVREQMRSFDYLATLDHRKRILGSGEMSMSESKMRLEAAFRDMVRAGSTKDMAKIVQGVEAFEFSADFIAQGLQPTVDGIVWEYISKPLNMDDPAAPEVFEAVFTSLAKRGLEVDTTAVMARERVDFCKAKDWKSESGTLLPKILKGLSSPTNPLVKGAMMTAIRDFEVSQILDTCDVGNERLMKALYQVTGNTAFVGKMDPAGRDRVFSEDLGL